MPPLDEKEKGPIRQQIEEKKTEELRQAGNPFRHLRPIFRRAFFQNPFSDRSQASPLPSEVAQAKGSVKKCGRSWRLREISVFPLTILIMDVPIFTHFHHFHICFLSFHLSSVLWILVSDTPPSLGLVLLVLPPSGYLFSLIAMS